MTDIIPDWAGRFWSKVDMTGGPEACWPWTACKNNDGYGRFMLHGKARRAHRVGFALAKGEIPDGLVLDHLCRNRDCCNPAHLEPVTVAENNRRGEAGINTRMLFLSMTSCQRGHPWPESTSYSKARGRYCRVCRTLHMRRYRAEKRYTSREASL